MFGTVDNTEAWSAGTADLANKPRFLLRQAARHKPSAVRPILFYPISFSTRRAIRQCVDGAINDRIGA
jgi:hypothetical protein